MKIGRRGFLVGVGGAVVSLPLLESLGSRVRANGDGNRRRFAVFVRSGNGVQQASGGEPEGFWPRELGPIDTATLRDRNADRAVSELAPYASQLNLVNGLRRPFGTPACGHSESIVQCLTAANHTGGPANNPLALGASADWRIVAELEPPGREPLTLMAGPQSAYIAEAISWREPRVRAPAERSPANAFMRLMGITSLPPEIRQRIVNRRNSILDLVREDMTGLMSSSQLGGHDRRRLQQHFDALRDHELEACEELAPERVAAIAAIANPQGNDVRPDVVRRHMELIAFAFNCGLARAATLQVGDGNDQTEYRIGGSRLPRFHWISHRIYSDGAEGEPIPNAVELHHQIDRLQLGLFRHLLDELVAYSSPYGGTLLDDTVAVWLNDLAEGPPHGGNRVPWILAGSAGGHLRTGQYIDAGGAHYNRILNSILTAVGCTDGEEGPVTNFGDSSLTRGLLDPLMA